jgi:hypothetical protein
MSQKWYQGSKGKVKVSWVALPIPGSKVKGGGGGGGGGTSQIGIRAWFRH